MKPPRMIATALTALAMPAQAQLVTHRDLSYPMARTIAESAIESCGAKGYPVSAVVVDRAGEVIVAMRADGAAPHTMENARRKAYTALSFRSATSDYARRYAENNPVVHQQVTLPGVIAIPGGLPVKLGEDVIAGVGVSGSPGVGWPAGGERSQGCHFGFDARSWIASKDIYDGHPLPVGGAIRGSLELIGHLVDACLYARLIVCVASTVLALPFCSATADPVADGLAAYERGDYAAAYKLCFFWAQQGNRDAEFLMGLMYANGRGVRQSYAEAAQWYQDAADDGQDSAENNLGQMYASGRGVRRSLAQAATLYSRAADQGNHRAQYNLAVAYKDGKGVERDYVRAYMWYTLSASVRWDPEVHDKASQERDDLAKEMTPAQITQAEAKAASWKPAVKPAAPSEPSPSNASPHHL